MTGGLHGVNKALFSTEYLDLSNYKVGWRNGTNLDFAVRKVPMLEDPATGSVYLVGAKKGVSNIFKVYRLNDVKGGWTALESMPKITRIGHVALFLPTELLSGCSTFVHSEL